jgi:hypothetical protein
MSDDNHRFAKQTVVKQGIQRRTLDMSNFPFLSLDLSSYCFNLTCGLSKPEFSHEPSLSLACDKDPVLRPRL